MTNSTYSRGIVAASLAGLLFGFDTAVIAGVNSGLRNAFNLDPFGVGQAASIALWGTLLGSIGAGPLGDRFGSKNVLCVVGMSFVVGAIGSASATNLWELFSMRFVGGLAIGASSVLAPVYIAEISPAAQRGARVGLFQLSIVIGILAAYFSNFLVDRVVAHAIAWRWKLGAGALPAAAFLILMLTVPQTSRWLASKGPPDSAYGEFSPFGGDKRAIASWSESQRYAIGEGKSRLSWKAHRRPIMLAVAIALFNQLSGINAVLYYVNDIFERAGFSTLSADAGSVAVGGMNLLATIVALTMIDTVGRRKLLLAGAVVTTAALGAIATIFAFDVGRALLLPILATFTAAFAFSQGAVIWVYLSEIFPTSVRARGQSVGSATHWGMNAIVTATFPIVEHKSAALPFVLFAIFTIIQFAVVLTAFPETKGRTLEEITDELASAP